MQSIVGRGGRGGRAPAAAAACLGGLAVVLALIVWLFPYTSFWAKADPKDPWALQQDARAVLDKLVALEAYFAARKPDSPTEPARPADQASGLQIGFHLDRATDEELQLPSLDLGDDDPTTSILYWTRWTAHETIIPDRFFLSGEAWHFRVGRITPRNPHPLTHGHTHLFLDARGRVRGFLAWPDRPNLPPRHCRDAWGQLRELVGAEKVPEEPPSDLPSLTIPVPYGQAWAWDGKYDGQSVHIDAAEYRGVPVFFWVSDKDEDEDKDEMKPRPVSAEVSAYRNSSGVFVNAIAFSLLVGIVLAWRNWHLGRADRRGARRLAAAVFLLLFAAWAVGGEHVPEQTELQLFQAGLGTAFYAAFFAWVFYVALEPYIRRSAPEALISWGRLILGGYDDPRVGRDFLAGLLAGSVFALILLLIRSVPGWLGSQPIVTTGCYSPIDTVSGPRRFVSEVLTLSAWSAVLALLTLLSLYVFQVLALGRRWVGVALFTLVWTFQLGTYERLPPEAWPVLAGVLVFVAAVMVPQFGLLSLVGLVFARLLLDLPLSVDADDWYWWVGASSLTILGTAALLAALVALGHRGLFPARPAT